MLIGELAEWLRSGLQIRVHEFESRTRLHFLLSACKTVAKGKFADPR